MKEAIKNIVEYYDNKLSKSFAIFIQFLIVLSVITFSIETLPNLKPQSRVIYNSIEIFCVVVFSVEYVARIFVADNKPRFIFSFFGLIDLFAILPFYLSFGVDLRSLRVLRMFR
jgi:voltage-gated potassium channel